MIRDSYSQSNLSDTVISIPEINVFAGNITDFAKGNSIQTIKGEIINAYRSENLADLLAHNSLVSVKSYGYGGLSSVSIRGMGTNHTAVIWNGFNLQSPMNGGVNFANLPVAFFDEIKVQYGGSGALYGSGAVGGSIHLNSVQKFGKGFNLKLNAAIGSFSNYNNNGIIGYSTKRYAFRVNILHQSGKNNFSYYLKGLGEKTQLNAAHRKLGVISTNTFKINSLQTLSLDFWYQNNSAQIPPNLTITRSEAKEDVDFFRYVLKWQYATTKSLIDARIAVIQDRQLYDDPLADIRSENTSKAIIGQCEAKFFLGQNDNLNIGLNYTLENGLSSNYEQVEQRNRTSIFLFYRKEMLRKKLVATINFREELIDQIKATIK